MHKGRLEAFSDAVIAIILTIMVLELRPPEQPTLESLRPLLPVFASYLLSFVFLGIYWNNHHHLLQASKGVTGGVLWANMHLLFWLSLVPFVTAWLGEAGMTTAPVASYGVVRLLSGIGYFILSKTLAHAAGADSAVARALGKDFKGKASVAAYALAIACAFISPATSCAIFVAIALLWLIPDRRFERAIRLPTNP